MPLYEYECDNGHRFEVIRKFSDPPVEKCPTCGSPVRKLIASPAIQFKGSGWYITDYARKDSGASKPDAPATDAAGSESKKSESKKSETGAPATGSSSTPAPTPAKKD
jgi:putative FmdB family regulatory protein